MPLCGRATPRLTRHHLVPRTLRKRNRTRRKFSRGERLTVILLCRSCHKQIHTLYTESELAGDYNSIEAFAAHPESRVSFNGLFANHRPLKSPFDVVEARVVKSERRGGG